MGRNWENKTLQLGNEEVCFQERFNLQRTGRREIKSTQLVVPEAYREKVMKVGHEILFGGHLGSKKTTDRVGKSFYWPCMTSDVKRYCSSCDACQRTAPRGSVSKLPLGQMPLIDIPFARVAVDIVGPIDPPTERGNR